MPLEQQILDTLKQIQEKAIKAEQDLDKKYKETEEFFKKSYVSADAQNAEFAKLREEMKATNEATRVQLEAAIAASKKSQDSTTAGSTLGQLVTKSENFETAQKSVASGQSYRMELAAKSLINPYGTDRLFGGIQRREGISVSHQPLTLAAIVPTFTSDIAIYQLYREGTIVNNANYQGTTPSGYIEGSVKNQSSIGNPTIINVPVITLAHFEKASRQVMSDAAWAESYLNNKLIHQLGVRLEQELLNGTATTDTLHGFLPTTTAVVVTGTAAEKVRKLKTVLWTRGFMPTHVVMNPADWEAIELEKAADGHYINGNALQMLQPTIWGVPVIPCASIAAGQMLIGNFTVGSTLAVREGIAVEFTPYNGTDFQNNMLTFKCEMRGAHLINDPRAYAKLT